jgi:hypothetical protein
MLFDSGGPADFPSRSTGLRCSLDDGEALILETDMPKVRHYWNIQLNDPLFNAVEYVYRLSSLTRQER